MLKYNNAKKGKGYCSVEQITKEVCVPRCQRGCLFVLWLERAVLNWKGTISRIRVH